MLEQMQWRSPFGDLPDAWKDRCMRRACWPKKIMYWEKSSEDKYGNRETIHEKRPPVELIWHIWHRDDVGDQSTYEGGLCQGWGGQLGFMNAETVLVNGDELTDGRMYHPTEGDRLAQDWESIGEK